MEVGVEVWVKDTKGDQSWISAVVQAKVLENFVMFVTFNCPIPTVSASYSSMTGIRRRRKANFGRTG